MKAFPRHSLLATAVASLFAAPASAVRLDEGGLGQALLFPYYTTRTVQGASFNALFSIVNH